jgi:hypothetical protein
MQFRSPTTAAIRATTSPEIVAPGAAETLTRAGIMSPAAPRNALMRLSGRGSLLFFFVAAGI